MSVPKPGYMPMPRIQLSREEQLEQIIKAFIEAHETLQHNFKHMPRTLLLIDGKLEPVTKLAQRVIG